MTELLYQTANGVNFDVPLLTYPDSMPRVAQLVTSALPHRVLLRPQSLASFVAAMFWLDALWERTGVRPCLVLPFIPGARQDRLNPSGDFLFTAKSIAAMINARNLPSVTVLDPHSEVAPALIDRCRVVHAVQCINPPPGKYQAVVSPDAGAEKRASMVASKLGVPLIHAWKSRDVASGAISGFGFDARTVSFLNDDGRSRTRRLLVVDDICDGGGTFTGLAREIKRQSEAVDLHLWTTHGIYSKGMGELAAHFSHIYCTDSVSGDRAGVIEVPVWQKLLDGEL